jgi:hypothetical protein
MLQEAHRIGIQIKPMKLTSTHSTDSDNKVIVVDVLKRVHPVVEMRPLKDLIS